MGMEIAGLENVEQSVTKMQGWKCETANCGTRNTEVGIAVLKNAEPESTGGKCMTGQCKTRKNKGKLGSNTI